MDRDVTQSSYQPTCDTACTRECGRSRRRTRTTQGDTTNPIGRIYPRKIIPWDDFPTKQEEIWNQLSDSSFALQSVLPSRHQLDYLRSLIGPISSEQGLQYFERDTVENAVQKLVDAVYADPPLRESLGLRGTVTFERKDSAREWYVEVAGVQETATVQKRASPTSTLPETLRKIKNRSPTSYGPFSTTIVTQLPRLGEVAPNPPWTRLHIELSGGGTDRLKEMILDDLVRVFESRDGQRMDKLAQSRSTEAEQILRYPALLAFTIKAKPSLFLTETK